MTTEHKSETAARKASSGTTSETSPNLELPVFGRVEADRILAADELFAIVLDKYPVSPGHCLVIARRPAPRFTDLKRREKTRLLKWVDWCLQHMQSSLMPTPAGFNLGLNDGAAAGQTIPQFHLHIIPRYAGDLPDPRGGVRWIFREKARYWEPAASAPE